MLAAERRNIIIERIFSEKKVIVNELSHEFDVSEETIRRDLEKLDSEGIVIKSYGGAVLNEKNNYDMPFAIRKKENVAGKAYIAKNVAKIIMNGEHIFLDPSTTGREIVRALKGKKNITLVTNSVEILGELTDANGWDIISTGGSLREKYLALVGTRAIECIGEFNVDKAVISCKGIDMNNGITDGNDDLSMVKRAMLENAKEKILAVDKSKFGMVGFSKICNFGDIDIVVTDEKPDDRWLELFDKNNIQCIY